MSLEEFVEEQFDQLYDRIRSLEDRLVEMSLSPPDPPLQSIAATSSAPPKPSRRARAKAPPAAGTAPPVSIPAYLPTSGTFPKEDRPDQHLVTVIVPDALAAHLIGTGGRGLKQIHDMSGAHVRAYEVKDGPAGARHVSIRGSDSQVGDALVVLGKRLARRRVRVPRQKGTKGPSRGENTVEVKAPLRVKRESVLDPVRRSPAVLPIPKSSAPPKPAASSALSTHTARSTPPVPSIVMQTATPPSLVATSSARSAATTPEPQPNSPIVPSVTMLTAYTTPGPSAGSPMNIDAMQARNSTPPSAVGAIGMSTPTESSPWSTVPAGGRRGHQPQTARRGSANRRR